MKEKYEKFNRNSKKQIHGIHYNWRSLNREPTKTSKDSIYNSRSIDRDAIFGLGFIATLLLIIGVRLYNSLTAIVMPEMQPKTEQNLAFSFKAIAPFIVSQEEQNYRQIDRTKYEMQMLGIKNEISQGKLY